MAQITTRKRGNTWEYSFEIGKINGKRKRQSKGGFRTKKECLEAGTKAKAEYDNGGIISNKTEITYNDFLDDWLNHIKLNYKENTYNCYEREVRLYIKPNLGIYKLTTIRPLIIQKLLDDVGKGMAYNHVKLIKAVISSSFDYAVFPCEYIQSNPCTNLKINKKKDVGSDTKTITLEQFNTVLNNLSKTTRYYATPLYIGWYTGARISEVLNLTWNDIDFENHKISITGDLKTKSSNRTILVSNNLIQILKKVKENSHSKYVCTKDGFNQINISYFKSNLHHLMDNLDFKFTFHKLRHTHATLLIQNGANIKDVQHRLGHSDVNTTLNVYTHINNDASSTSVNILDAISEFMVDKW